jgi:glycosyltransferase involved in cell wall biosynthesis
MHIAIITDRFTPEVSAASTRLLAHAQYWVGEGHQVTVLTCAPNFPKGRLFPGYRNAWTRWDDLDGVRILRVWSYLAPNVGVIRRSLDYLSFMVSAVLHARSLGRPDVILASSPPITVAFAGSLIARILGRPWVFEVRDLWPASIRAVGFSRNPLLGMLEWLELRLYEEAAGTIVLTEPFREELRSRSVDMRRVAVVTNGIDSEAWRTTPDHRNTMRATLGLPLDAFIVGFVGTTGLSQGAGVFVRTAQRMARYPDIHFLCLGEGADRPALEAAAREAGLRNITFHDFIPFKDMPKALAALDVGTVLLKNDPVFDTVIPSKLLELMAGGLPIAAAAGRETARIVTAAGAGICVPPEDDAGLEDAILRLRNDPAGRRRMAAEGQAYVGREFDRATLAERALAMLGDIVEKSR